MTSSIGVSAGWAFAVRAKIPMLKHRTMVIFVIVRICRLSVRAGTGCSTATFCVGLCPPYFRWLSFFDQYLHHSSHRQDDDDGRQIDVGCEHAISTKPVTVVGGAAEPADVGCCVFGVFPSVAVCYFDHSGSPMCMVGAGTV